MSHKDKFYGCVRCMTYKPRDSFEQPGTNRKRIDSVCLECREVERLDREARAARRERRRTTKEVDGVLSRRCGKCREWKPLTLEFYYRSKSMRDGSKDFDYYCKACQTARTTKRARERRNDPLMGKVEREKRRRRTQNWRKRNPDRARKLAKEYKDRVRQDPERRAQMLETQRIAYRLRKERQGIDYNEQRQNGKVPGAHRGPSGKASRLDVEPLREWVEAVVARSHSITDLCNELGIHERQLMTIRRAEYKTVTLSVADTLLTRYGQPVRVNGFGPVEFLWDLWPELGEVEE